MVVIFLSAAVLLALVLYFALEQKKRERITGFTFFLAAIGGLIIYGLSYSYEAGGFSSNIEAALKTILDVGQMFVGSDNEAVYNKMLTGSGLNGEGWHLLFWLVHFIAYYSTASAVILTLGKGVARRIQLWLLNIRNVELIYGITESSITMGRHLSKDKRYSVVFVGQATAAQELAIRQMKALLFTDEIATKPKEGFLKLISISERKGWLRVYAISNDIEANYNYSLRLLKLLEKKNVPAERISLILLGQEEKHGADLQNTGNHYGYGEVVTFGNEEQTARLLIQKYPPCLAMDFDNDGKATADMEILLVGFGRLGQEILNKLVANSQFEGSNFRADVFDPNYSSKDGFYRMNYGAMLNEYNIVFHSEGGSSRDFCAFIKERSTRLRYVVVAIGDSKKGQELSEDILGLIEKCGNGLPVYECCDNSVTRRKLNEESITYSLHDMDILFGGDMDQRAVQINHYYHDPDVSAREQWIKCDYFSRMSCRASADFLSSFLPHLNATDMKNVSEEKLDNLSKTEHLRWNAFHFSMGYELMPDEEWKQRAKEYRRQEREGVEQRINISKNAEDKRHACLVTWDQLDELSQRENAVTGKNIDYKYMDRRNIITMSKIISSSKN